MNRQSHTRMRADVPVLDVAALVLTSDGARRELIEQAAPEAYRVICAGTRVLLNVELASRPVLCALVVDMDLDRHRLRELLGVVARRWTGLPTLAVYARPSRRLTERAYQHASTIVAMSDPPRQRHLQVGSFLRVALDDRLDRVANILSFLEDKGVDGDEHRIAVARSIQRVLRAELPAHLDLTPSQLGTRIANLAVIINGASGKNNLLHCAERLAAVPKVMHPRYSGACLERAILLSLPDETDDSSKSR